MANVAADTRPLPAKAIQMCALPGRVRRRLWPLQPLLCRRPSDRPPRSRAGSTAWLSRSVADALSVERTRTAASRAACSGESGDRRAELRRRLE